MIWNHIIMEFLPPEISEIIITSLSDPKDLGCLRLVNSWWNLCVNTFTRHLETQLMISWDYLRRFERVKFDGTIAVNDPALVETIVERHPCTGLMLIVLPKDRANWEPKTRVGMLRCMCYAGIVQYALTSGQSIGCIRSFYGEPSSRIQELEKSSPIYLFYQSITSLYIIWSTYGPITNMSQVKQLNQAQQDIADWLIEMGAETLIRDYRMNLDRVVYSANSMSKLANGWITDVSESGNSTDPVYSWLTDVRKPTYSGYLKMVRQYRVWDYGIHNESCINLRWILIQHSFQDFGPLIQSLVEPSKTSPTETPLSDPIGHITLTTPRMLTINDISRRCSWKSLDRLTARPHWNKYQLRGNSRLPRSSKQKRFQHR